MMQAHGYNSEHLEHLLKEQSETLSLIVQRQQQFSEAIIERLDGISTQRFSRFGATPPKAPLLTLHPGRGSMQRGSGRRTRLDSDHEKIGARPRCTTPDNPTKKIRSGDDETSGQHKTTQIVRPSAAGMFSALGKGLSWQPSRISQQIFRSPSHEERMDDTLKGLTAELNAIHAQLHRRSRRKATPGQELMGVMGLPSATTQSPDRLLRSGTWLKSIVVHTAFDMFCAMMIILNAGVIGASVEYQTSHDEEHIFFTVAGHCFSAFFFVELVMRMSAFGKTFFTRADRVWNVFDLLLVIGSAIDVVMTVGDMNSDQVLVGSSWRSIRFLRIVRVVRVFRFCRDLSLMALMIMDSMKALVWAMLLLGIMMYTFAICFVQGTTAFFEDQGSRDSHDDLRKYFGSIPRTFYTLIQAMLGGVSWGVFADALMPMGWFFTSLFFFYIIFALLAVLNIITGVFVDNAFQVAKSERDVLIKKEMEIKRKFQNEMRTLLDEMDMDASGSISWEEFEAHFGDERVKAYFQVLGLAPTDIRRLFDLVDEEKTGEVNIIDFVDKTLTLKGEATSIEAQTILSHCRKIEQYMSTLAGEILARPPTTVVVQQPPAEVKPSPVVTTGVDRNYSSRRVVGVPASSPVVGAKQAMGACENGKIYGNHPGTLSALTLADTQAPLELATVAHPWPFDASLHQEEPSPRVPPARAHTAAEPPKSPPIPELTPASLTEPFSFI